MIGILEHFWVIIPGKSSPCLWHLSLQAQVRTMCDYWQQVVLSPSPQVSHLHLKTTIGSMHKTVLYVALYCADTERKVLYCLFNGKINTTQEVHSSLLYPAFQIQVDK